MLVVQVLRSCRCQEGAHQQTRPVIWHKKHFSQHYSQSGEFLHLVFWHFSLTTTSCFMFSSLSLWFPTGPIGVAHSPALPVPTAADTSGCVHLFSYTLWRQCPLAGLHGHDHLHREGRDPLFLPEEPESTPRRRQTAASGKEQPALAKPKLC